MKVDHLSLIKGSNPPQPPLADRKTRLNVAWVKANQPRLERHYFIISSHSKSNPMILIAIQSQKNDKPSLSSSYGIQIMPFSLFLFETPTQPVSSTSYCFNSWFWHLLSTPPSHWHQCFPLTSRLWWPTIVEFVPPKSLTLLWGSAAFWWRLLHVICCRKEQKKTQ